jgi:hypothetical protein
MWQQWVNAILGLWVLAAPFLGLSASTLTWTLAISGAVIALLALWSMQEVKTGRESGRMIHRTQS